MAILHSANLISKQAIRNTNIFGLMPVLNSLENGTTSMNLAGMPSICNPLIKPISNLEHRLDDSFAADNEDEDVDVVDEEKEQNKGSDNDSGVGKK